MDKRDRLFEVAERQQGYFTSRQAVQCGFKDANFNFYLNTGEWLKEGRGVYRLARYPMTESPDLVMWALWSRGRGDVIHGVWSHETALAIYDLSDINPANLHLTVPVRFRKSAPDGLILHFCNLEPKDIRERMGYLATTPLRTLLDIAEEGRLAKDLIKQATQQALSRGIVLRTELDAIDSPSAKQLIELLNDPTIRERH
jgi:predicted transcriptional regulator of viral defense system